MGGLCVSFLADPKKTSTNLIFSMPRGHCLHFYPHFAKYTTTPTFLWWTLKQCPAVWISQFGLCKQVGEGKQLPILVLVQAVLIKKPSAQEAGCCLFSHPFPPWAGWKHKPLSNMEMDSGKCVAESNLAVLGGNVSKRPALFCLYILLFSITGLIFLKLSAKCSPARHQPSKQGFQKSSSAI